MPKLSIPRDAVINGFTYSFIEGLVKKLKKLIATGRAFKQKTGEDESGELTDIAYAVVQLLGGQIPTSASASNHTKPKKLDRYIIMVEEILAAFVVEE